MRFSLLKNSSPERRSLFPFKAEFSLLSFEYSTSNFKLLNVNIEGDLTIGCELLVSVIDSDGSTHLLNLGDKCSTLIGSLFEESD